MKTIKKGGEVVRKNDKEARELIKTGWSFCPKAEYKKLHQAPKVTKAKVEVPVDKKPKSKYKVKQENKA